MFILLLLLLCDHYLLLFYYHLLLFGREIEEGKYNEEKARGSRGVTPEFIRRATENVKSLGAYPPTPPTHPTFYILS